MACNLILMLRWIEGCFDYQLFTAARAMRGMKGTYSRFWMSMAENYEISC